MSEEQTERSQPIEQGAEKTTLSTPEAQGARNAEVGQVKAAQDLNQNRHDGSAGGDKTDSIVIESDGKVVASRELPKTEKEIAALKPSDSISIAELKDRAGRQTGYPWAESVLRKLETAQNMPAGASKEEALAKAQDMADLMARRGPYALDAKTSDQSSIDFMTQKSQEALAALQNPSDEQVLIASNITPAVPNLQSGEIPYTRSDATNAAAPDATLAQGAALDYSLKRAQQKSVEDSHKLYDGRNATNNEEFLEMFLAGSGNDKQVHSVRGAQMLEAFIKSPGAAAIRAQYLKENCPAFTKDLGFGTVQAFQETMLPKVDGSGVKFPDYSSPGVHVGGFGNPPKDQPKGACTATRCDKDGNPAKMGGYVQFQVVNLAGEHSWFLHLPFVKDKPQGQKGERRTITEIFQWIEPLPAKGDKK